MDCDRAPRYKFLNQKKKKKKILEAVGVLGPGLTSSSSLSSFSEEEEGSGDAFLESSAAETLLEERLPVQQA